MEGLAIFGLVMMGAIAMLLQHLANYLFREDDEHSTVVVGLITFVSMIILIAMVSLAVNTF